MTNDPIPKTLSDARFLRVSGPRCRCVAPRGCSPQPVASRASWFRRPPLCGWDFFIFPNGMRHGPAMDAPEQGTASVNQDGTPTFHGLAEHRDFRFNVFEAGLNSRPGEGAERRLAAAITPRSVAAFPSTGLHPKKDHGADSKNGISLVDQRPPKPSAAADPRFRITRIGTPNRAPGPAIAIRIQFCAYASNMSCGTGQPRWP